MATLLYVESSPRKQHSASIEVAKAFLDAYAQSHTGDRIETLDLWAEDLPPFDGATIEAKYAILHGQKYSSEQAAAWQAVVRAFERFNAADKYLFSVPMWNFGIPYKLKHYIDVINQPGLSFSFSPEGGYKGLVTGKPAAVVYSRGGEYSQPGAAAMDLQKAYLELWLRFIGFSDIHSIVVEPTLQAPEVVAKTKSVAKDIATKIAKTL